MPFVLEIVEKYTYSLRHRIGFHSSRGLVEDIQDASLLDEDEVIELRAVHYKDHRVFIFLLVEDMEGKPLYVPHHIRLEE